MVSVAVSEMGVILHQTRSENQVLLEYLTVSTNIMKRVIDGNFIFQQDSALMIITFNTVQLLQCKTPIFLSFWAVTPK